MNKIGRQCRQLLVITPRPAIFDRQVLALDITGLVQALAKGTHKVREQVRRSAMEEADHRHRQLLCARHKRPRGCAAEQRDELAPSHVEPPPPESAHRTLNLPQSGRASPLGEPEFILNRLGYCRRVPSPNWGCQRDTRPSAAEIRCGSFTSLWLLRSTVRVSASHPKATF